MAASAPAGELTADQQAEELVRQLGDDSFQVRQRAMRELAKLGVPAKQALLDGLKQSDAEVRWRCRHVLESVLELDLRARLARFAADEDGSEGLTLPGWDRYRSLVGDDTTSRELFVEMQRAEPDLLEAAETPTNLLDEAMQIRCAQIQQVIFAPDPKARRSAPFGSVAALFFVASQSEVQVTDALVSYLHTFSYQPAFQQAMSDPRRSKPLRTLLGAWVGRNSGSFSTYHNFMLSLQYGLEEALDPAIAAIRSGNAQPYAEQYALLVVGRFGGPDHTQYIEALLDDHNVLGTNNVDKQEVRTEVSDIALAILVHLTGQDHAAYGFKFLQKSPQSVIQPLSAGFADDTERQTAIKKWRDWAAKPRD
jgi:hypothetical protein